MTLAQEYWLAEAVKANDKLIAKNSELEKRIAELEARLKALETEIDYHRGKL